ncbi:MAG TPA: protein kinase, partial [Pirellulales bacterium]
DLLATSLAEIVDGWHRGEKPSAERWLERHPELAADSEIAVRLIYEEVCLREDHGERVDSTELYRRFPQWREAIAVVLDCHHLMPSIQQPAQFPATGETLGEFRLLHELGRGALGRVFLATQPTLSDRPIVVKLTAQTGQEHLSLARLQHTHIVPLYLVQDFPDVYLRALCMPYLGGATWSAILQGLQSKPAFCRTGKQIVDRLNQLEKYGAKPRTAAGPAITFLARSNYIEAVCWIGACLADALQYAHQRGLVHLDIKPSNVLLSGDGQPMLLDFHLACELSRLAANTVDRLGGTPGYMSPEQAAATTAFKAGRPMPQPIDGRSDIYSLGVLLYESLAGELPPADSPPDAGMLRWANPEVSRGLTEIVCKCLADNSSARYGDAGLLATDLRCHLANLPLRGVPNRSLAERWQKWRRRRAHALPILISGLLLIVLAIASMGVGGLFYRERIRSAESELLQSQREFNNGDYLASSQHAEMGRGSLHWLTWKTDLIAELDQQIEAAQRAQSVVELHELVEKLRFIDDQQLSDKALANVAQICGEIWKVRDVLAAPLKMEDANAASKSIQLKQLRHDLLDLAILSARLNFRIAPPSDKPEARVMALQQLAQAVKLCGESPVLNLAEREYSVDSGEIKPDLKLVSLPTVMDAWEHYAIGRWLMHQGLLSDAEHQIAEATQLLPNDFWSNFQLARCNYELSRFDQALTSATVCVALAPERALCYYNRALCYQAINRDSDAMYDFATALKLDPKLAPAAFAQGMLLIKLSRLDDAEVSFKWALTAGIRPSEVDYQFARISLAKHDMASARQWLENCLALDPANSDAQALQKKILATVQ